MDIRDYQRTLKSSSNAVSNVILSDVWEKHILNHENSDIFESVEHHLKSKYTRKVSTWTTSLRQIDPSSLFKQSLPPCPECCHNISNHRNIETLQRNSCKCDLQLSSSFKPSAEKRKSMFLESLNNNETREKSKPFEEPKFVPKFGCSKNANRVKTPPLTKPYSVPKEMEFDIEVVDEEKAHCSNVAKITFKTAREQFLALNPGARRTIGASRRAQGKFVSPMLAQGKQETCEQVLTDERMKHLDPKMVELIENEIMDNGTPIEWDDIAGLQTAKSVIQEAVVWPLLRPDIFTGLRRPPKGILLFGPPGTGKTLIGKCVAAQCNATFFNISASSLTSKWIGDGEKMVRTLFAVARCHQPAVIFIDEIDSLLTQRSDTEHESTRRIKTEFLVQLDGAATGEDDRLLIVGATNRPQELDEAARRRLVKRLYIALPDIQARRQIIYNLMRNESNSLQDEDIDKISHLTDGYSGADMKSLCSEAAMGPIRSVPLSQIATIQKDCMRPVNVQDFEAALDRVRPSVSQDDLGQYEKWNKTYGHGL